MPSRRSLHFAWRPVEGEAGVAECVRTITNLRQLVIDGDRWFGDHDAEELGAALAHNTSLRELRLNRCMFGARGLRCITEALSTNTVFERLTILCNDLEIGNNCGELLADLLVSTSSLRHLTLNTRSRSFGEVGARAIADALKVNTTLEGLYISGNEIGDAGAAALAGGLAVNSSLRELHANFCGIGAAGSRAIADALKINTTLEELYIANNNIGLLGSRAIAEALKVNTTLERLFISDNEIGDAGAAALADGLAVNSALRQLHANTCGIGAAGSRAIAEALKINTTLEKLRIVNNKVGNAGAAALAGAVATTTSLSELHLATNYIGEEGEMALGKAWGGNLALSFDFCLNSYDNRIRNEALRVRALLLHRRELLLAFGMAMLERLGGGTDDSEQAGSASSSTKRSAFHRMNKDVFKLVGEGVLRDYCL
jgi:Ran GTPase-activating protein (RanGAP) involved in mRNA processing and transport